MLTHQLHASLLVLTALHCFHLSRCLSWEEGRLTWAALTVVPGSCNLERFTTVPIDSKLRSPLTAGRPAMLTPTAPLVTPTIATGNVRRLLGTSTRRMMSLGTRSKTPKRNGRTTTDAPVLDNAMATRRDWCSDIFCPLVLFFCIF